MRRELLRIGQRGELSAARLQANPTEFAELWDYAPIRVACRLRAEATHFEAAHAFVSWLKALIEALPNQAEREVGEAAFALGTYEGRSVTERAHLVQECLNIGEDLWRKSRDLVLNRALEALAVRPAAQAGSLPPPVKTEDSLEQQLQDHLSGFEYCLMYSVAQYDEIILSSHGVPAHLASLYYLSQLTSFLESHGRHVDPAIRAHLYLAFKQAPYNEHQWSRLRVLAAHSELATFGDAVEANPDVFHNELVKPWARRLASCRTRELVNEHMYRSIQLTNSGRGEGGYRFTPLPCMCLPHLMSFYCFEVVHKLMFGDDLTLMDYDVG